METLPKFKSVPALPSPPSPASIRSQQSWLSSETILHESRSTRLNPKYDKVVHIKDPTVIIPRQIHSEPNPIPKDHASDYPHCRLREHIPSSLYLLRPSSLLPPHILVHIEKKRTRLMMEPLRILIANRSEIACRLIRTYQLFPLDEATPPVQSVAVYTASESKAMHVAQADVAHQLDGEGPKAYLNARAMVEATKKHNCWAIAPGYGFLSEDADFSQLCHDNDVVFLGPTSRQLRMLGNKVSARGLAMELDVPVLEGTRLDHLSSANPQAAPEDASPSPSSSQTLPEVVAFAATMLPGSKIILKAASGGGGRGIRVVSILDSPTETRRAISGTFDSCSREAAASFGDSTVYPERFLVDARHVEVQVLGDGKGGVCHFWDRECSLQRRNQKMIEVAPAPNGDVGLRRAMIGAALRMAAHVRLRSLATFEFLVEAHKSGPGAEGNRFYFMEANPRIQVEHTIIENVTGHDLVAL